MFVHNTVVIVMENSTPPLRLENEQTTVRQQRQPQHASSRLTEITRDKFGEEVSI